MNKLNGIAFVGISILIVKDANGETRTDKHGKLPIILSPIAGKFPDKRVLAGTMAERAGLISYDDDNNPELLARNALVAFLEQDESFENGRQFNFTFSALNLTALEQLQTIKSLGTPSLIRVREADAYLTFDENTTSQVEDLVVENSEVL